MKRTSTPSVVIDEYAHQLDSPSAIPKVKDNVCFRITVLLQGTPRIFGPLAGALQAVMPVRASSDLLGRGHGMNWDAVAAIRQVLGSVAVFITLGYLAVQVRHQRREIIAH